MEERIEQISWVIFYLEDVRSDLSAFHRIEELECMPSDRFFALAERLVSYEGTLQARARAELLAEQDDGSAVTPIRARQAVPGASSKNLLPTDKVEVDDNGQRLVNGFAVDENNVPLWVKNRPGKSLGSEVDVVPGDPAALAFTPAFQGQFSYAKVRAGGDEPGS